MTENTNEQVNTNRRGMNGRSSALFIISIPLYNNNSSSRVGSENLGQNFEIVGNQINIFNTTIPLNIAECINLVRKKRLQERKMIRDELRKTRRYVFKNGMDMKECSICLSNFNEGEKIRELWCGHEFHRKCVDKWVWSGKLSCPFCRVSLNAKASSARTLSNENT